jgi:TerC family integral membrane protein
MPWQGWCATVAGLIVVGLLDLGVIARRKREITMRDATGWVLFYVGLAAAFAVMLVYVRGRQQAGEFVAGYVTEYSLSVDNLFVFLLIMTRLRVPALAQDKGLYIGIVLSLALRTVCIVAGAVALSHFTWIFYGLGAFLIYTAIRLVTGNGDPAEGSTEYAVVRLARRILPITKTYHGNRIMVLRRGKRAFTPMLIAILAIGMANVVFALDSIPAIFGLTTDPYIVFTANAFALMGLRQLYFMVAGLLGRLHYLDVGLCVILCFIGVKLLLEALRSSGVRSIGPVPVPSIGIAASLAVIVLALGGTVLAGWLRSRQLSKASR